MLVFQVFLELFSPERMGIGITFIYIDYLWDGLNGQHVSVL